MLEAQAHSHLKSLLRREESNWPHHLTLSRLWVAASGAGIER